MCTPSIVEAERAGVPLELEGEHALDDTWRSIGEQADGDGARQSNRVLCEEVRCFGGVSLDHERRLRALHRHDGAFGQLEEAGATLVVRAVLGENAPQLVHPVGDDRQLLGRLAVQVHDSDPVEDPIPKDLHSLFLSLSSIASMTAQQRASALVFYPFCFKITSCVEILREWVAAECYTHPNAFYSCPFSSLCQTFKKIISCCSFPFRFWLRRSLFRQRF